MKTDRQVKQPIVSLAQDGEAASLCEGTIDKVDFRGRSFDEVAKAFTRSVFGKEFIVQ